MTQKILVTGARGVFGPTLVQRFVAENFDVLPVSRTPEPIAGIAPLTLDLECDIIDLPHPYETVIHCAPLWLLPRHIDHLQRFGTKKIIAFSSSSVASKFSSKFEGDQILVQLLQTAESDVRRNCIEHSIDLTIIRPTMIYGYGRDANVTRLIAFMKKYHVLPILRPASGWRQPIHVDDVCLAVKMLFQSNIPGESQVLTLAGKERMTYKDMIKRIRHRHGLISPIVPLPLALFKILLRLIEKQGMFKGFDINILLRINEDLVYDHTSFELEIMSQFGPFRP